MRRRTWLIFILVSIIGIVVFVPTITRADEVASIIAKYGKPDLDDSTAYDKPRPPIVTRWIVYQKQHVKFIFLVDAPIGSPPPYSRWKLIGASDDRTNQPIAASEVDSRMKSNLASTAAATVNTASSSNEPATAIIQFAPLALLFAIGFLIIRHFTKKKQVSTPTDRNNSKGATPPMASGKIRFRNPANGYEEDVTLAWLWCLLFGCLYFAIKGVWAHALISAVIALFTLGLSWLVYPFFARGIVEKHYLRMGWQRVAA